MSATSSRRSRERRGAGAALAAALATARGLLGGALAACLLLVGAAAGAETLSYSGDSLKVNLAKGSERVVLTGNARVATGDSVFRADEITLYGEDNDRVVARGNVRVVDAKRGVDLSAEELLYDRQTRIARIQGNAVMADLENEIVVKGGFIEDRDTEGLTIVQVGVRILKEDLVCRAEFAKYWRERKVLELSGMPFVTRRGDEYRADRITIDLETEEITLEGDVEGTATSAEEEEQPAEQPPEGETVPAGPAAAPTEPAASDGGAKP